MSQPSRPVFGENQRGFDPHSAVSSERLSSLVPCALVVTNQQLVGILTQQDIVKLVATGRDISGLQAKDGMTPPAMTLRPEAFQDGESILDQLTCRHIHHLPIVDDHQRVLGLVTANSLRTALQAGKSQKTHRRDTLSTLMSHVPGMAYRCSNRPDWPFEFVSEGCIQLSGYGAHELLAQQAYVKLVHPADRDTVTQAMNAALAEGRPFQLTYRILTAQGIQKWVWDQGCPLSDPSGNRLGFEGFVTDITEWKHTEAELQLSRFCLDRVVDAVFLIRPDAQIAYVNDGACRALGYSQAQLLDMAVSDFDLNYTPAKWKRTWKKLQRKSSLTLESTYLYNDGTAFPVEIRVNPLNFQGEDYACAIARDMTKWKQAQVSLQESELRSRAIFEQAAVGIGEVNIDGRFLRVNGKYNEILGYSETELRQLKGQDITHPEDLKGNELRVHELLAHERTNFSIEKRYIRKDGSIVWANLSSSLVGSPTGEPQYFIVVVQDITERKLAEEALRRSEEQLKVSLADKELLLKEVHHRVKNNLQVISSLFSLQSQSISDPRVLSILADSQHRIASMALIHEKLYQSHNLANINFSDYLRSLVSNLFSSYNISPNLIQLRTQIADIPLNLDTAISCGLLINELVSNSLKHAFPDQRSGEIQLTFSMDPEQQLCLRVQDTGIGLPSGIDLQQRNSLGLRLIRALTRQLKGQLDIRHDAGTTFEVRFPYLNTDQ